MQLPRVRRLKYHGYDAAAIEHSCREDIAMMRALAVPQEIARELWVRGPDRAWHRYCVLPESIEVIERDDGPGL